MSHSSTKQKRFTGRPVTVDDADDAEIDTSGGFFADFDAGTGPSNRKRARELADREARVGKSLEDEAMDPVVSAAAAREKIAALVRQRAGRAAVDPRAVKSVGGKHSEPDTADGTVLPSGGRTAKEKLQQKFARKGQRAELQRVHEQKNKRVLRKQQAAGGGFKAKRRRH